MVIFHRLQEKKKKKTGTLHNHNMSIKGLVHPKMKIMSLITISDVRVKCLIIIIINKKFAFMVTC